MRARGNESRRFAAATLLRRCHSHLAFTPSSTASAKPRAPPRPTPTPTYPLAVAKSTAPFLLDAKLPQPIQERGALPPRCLTTPAPFHPGVYCLAVATGTAPSHPDGYRLGAAKSTAPFHPDAYLPRSHCRGAAHGHRHFPPRHPKLPPSHCSGAATPSSHSTSTATAHRQRNPASRPEERELGLPHRDDAVRSTRSPPHRGSRARITFRGC